MPVARGYKNVIEEGVYQPTRKSHSLDDRVIFVWHPDKGGMHI
jgi:hypothetical protein